MAQMIGNVTEEVFYRTQRMVEIMAARWYLLNRSRCPPSWDEDDARAAARIGLTVAAR